MQNLANIDEITTHRDAPTTHQFDERKQAIKVLQARYNKEHRFPGELKEDWNAHLIGYTDLCDDFEVPESDRVYFLKLKLGGDAFHFYCEQKRLNHLRWEGIKELFSDPYASRSKHEEVWQRLQALRITTFMRYGTDSYEVLERFVRRIKKLTPMARPRDQDNEGKDKHLSKAVIGTKFGLRAISRLQPDPSFPRLSNALTTYFREMHIHTASTGGGSEARGSTNSGPVFRKSLWDGYKVPENNANSQVHYTGQRRFGRDPRQVR